MATALITGASAGIGAAFARALAARGEDLVLVARNADRLQEMALQLKDRYGVNVEVLPADLGDFSEVQRVAERLTDQARPVDTLVNNAGFAVETGLTAEDLAPHLHAVDVMIRAVLVLGGVAGRAMRGRGRGVIINVSSTAGFVALGSYSAIKAWVTAYSESLAVELAGTGVTVTALCPGWVHTEFHQRADINVSSVAKPLWLDADELVAECLHDVDHGKVISIPSKRYQFLMFLTRHAPRGAVRRVSSRITSRREQA